MIEGTGVGRGGALRSVSREEETAGEGVVRVVPGAGDDEDVLAGPGWREGGNEGSRSLLPCRR